METLMVMDDHRSQFSTKSHSSNQFSSPSRTFQAINCRTFQSGSPPKRSKPVNITPKKLAKSTSEDLSLSSPLSLSTPFAGPAFSNSPPPSSLPIPKFSLRQKRSVSFDLPVSRADVAVRQIARSAPSSPSGDRNNGFCFDAAIATENLRRILRLDDD